MNVSDPTWICDVRTGCVAVYRGPRRDCLDGISDDPACIFYRHGEWMTDHWRAWPSDIAMAKRIADAMNGEGTRDAQLAALTARAEAAERERDAARRRLLSAAGDDLCRLSQDEIKAMTSGAVQIPPKEEFLASCERFHAQVAKEAGVLDGCLTLAQLVSENEKLRSERDEARQELASAAESRASNKRHCKDQCGHPDEFVCFDTTGERFCLECETERLRAECDVITAERDEAIALREAADVRVKELDRELHSQKRLKEAHGKMIEGVWKDHERQFAAIERERDEARQAARWAYESMGPGSRKIAAAILPEHLSRWPWLAETEKPE